MFCLQANPGFLMDFTRSGGILSTRHAPVRERAAKKASHNNGSVLVRRDLQEHSAMLEHHSK